MPTHLRPVDAGDTPAFLKPSETHGFRPAELEVAQIPDVFADGEEKVIFTKRQ